MPRDIVAWALAQQGGGGGEGTVQDVQINGTSILSSGVANIPSATTSTEGVMPRLESANVPIQTQSTKFMREDGTWSAPSYTDVDATNNLYAWSSKEWTGLTSFVGADIWTDGDNIYYSNYSDQYVLDKQTSTWSIKTWYGKTDIEGRYVWSDGDNIYYSTGSKYNQYVLDKQTSTWSTKTWTGLPSYGISGNDVWTDGNNIYYSYYSDQYVLDKQTSTWSSKEWTGLTSFVGFDIWSDGNNIYYSSYWNHFVLDKQTSTWSPITWAGLSSFVGFNIWTDGDGNYYYSDGSYQYVLDKQTSTWSPITWAGINDFYGDGIWTDGDNIYYSDASDQYVLLNDSSVPTYKYLTINGSYVKLGDCPVKDIQFNGVSKLVNGIANVTDSDIQQVKYSSQTLTENQKAQARTNIGAGEAIEIIISDNF